MKCIINIFKRKNVRICFIIILFVIIIFLSYFSKNSNAYINLNGNNMQGLSADFYWANGEGVVDKITLSDNVCAYIFADSFHIYKDDKLISSINDNTFISFKANRINIYNNNGTNINYKMALRSYNPITYSNGNDFYMHDSKHLWSDDKRIVINDISPLTNSETVHSWKIEVNDCIHINPEYEDILNGDLYIIAENITGIGGGTQCNKIHFLNDKTTNYEEKWTLYNVKKCNTSVKGELIFSRGKEYPEYKVGNQEIEFSTNTNYPIPDEESLTIDIIHEDEEYLIYSNGEINKLKLNKTNLFYTFIDWLSDFNIIGIILSTIITVFVTQNIEKRKNNINQDTSNETDIKSNIDDIKEEQ